MSEARSAAGDFSQGSIPKLITHMALPMMLAEIVNILYNIVDRVYIGNIPSDGALALAGIGIANPVIMLIAAFAGLVGIGGTPLCSMARGKGDDEDAAHYVGTSFSLLLVVSAALMLFFFLFLNPVLRLFGATDILLPYARRYIRIYLAGTPFGMLALGMNSYVNAQGFPRRGMLTILSGAIANILLDPIFIYTFHMGVEGAAVATVLSQILSSALCVGFLFSDKPPLKLNRAALLPDGVHIRNILSLGTANATMKVTDAIVAALVNNRLTAMGDESAVGAMVIILSLRSFFGEMVTGFGTGMRPVIGYNYGAGLHARVLQCIRFSTLVLFSLAGGCWLLMVLFIKPLAAVFTPDPALIAATAHFGRIYFAAFCFMSLQSGAQGVFVGLGKSKMAIFFSFFRKVALVAPLTVILSYTRLGVDGIFWAEPISEIVGGLAVYITMLITVYFPTRRLLKEETAR